MSIASAPTASGNAYRFTTERPVAVAMVFLAVLVFGAFSVRLLPLTLMPDISYPKLTIRTEYPGAAPAEVENNVARPLEDVLGVVTGLSRIESISRANVCDVVLEFAWSSDMDEANQDVLEILDAVRPNLPDGIKTPLILRYDPALDPVLTLSVRGEGPRFEGTAGLKLLRRIADRDVRRLLEPVDGVAAVKVVGGLEEEIEVDLDEGQLRRTGIGIDTVVARLKAENIDLAGGTLEHGRTRYLVRTVNEFRDLADIGELVITRVVDRDVRLRDLATIHAGFADREVITRVDGAEAVEIEIYKEADANIVEMATRVRERVDHLHPALEHQYGARLAVSTDRSRFIESSIAEVQGTAVQGGLLAVLVLMVFLRDLRSTIIIGLSIPVSILVTFAPLQLFGVSLNVMSLGGLALGVGMLVDNAIVVLESIHRCREDGDDVVASALRGTAEVGGAVIASTLTTIAVFLPMVFVEGVAGQMFGDLGLAVVFSLLASLAVALFLVPMLASRGRVLAAAPGERTDGLFTAWRRSLVRIRAPRELADSVRAAVRAPWRWLGLPYVLARFVVRIVLELVGKLALSCVLALALVLLLVIAVIGRVLTMLAAPLLAMFGVMIAWVERIYPQIVRASLRHAALVYGLAAASLGLTAWGLVRLDTELLPVLHQGELTVQAKFPVGTSLASTEARVQALERRVRAETPHLAGVTTTIGSERDNADESERGEHTARLRLVLAAEAPAAGLVLGGAAASERIEREALAAVRAAVAPIPDLEVGISRPVLFSFKTPIAVEVRGHDLEDLALATHHVEQALRGIPGLRDVRSSLQPGNPEVRIHYDRDALARLGLDLRKVAELVRDEVQGTEATRFNRSDRKIPVRVRLADIEDATLDELRSLVVNPGGARPVPLGAVATLELGQGPSEIRRIGQQRVGLVEASLERTGLATATKAIERTLATTRLPPEVTTVLTGQSEEWDTSSRSLSLALGLSIFLVYVIMAAQFESLVYPLIILVSIPLAFVGVVGVLHLAGLPLSVVVFLGSIMLAGIVVNNAIVLVDYVGTLKARGIATEHALELAGRVRLRPILMTTLTTVLGLVPMALGLGDGAEIRAPMALTVIAGLSCSTVLTLVVIPTLYAGIDRLRGHTVAPSLSDRLDLELARITPEALAPESEADADAEPGP